MGDLSSNSQFKDSVGLRMGQLPDLCPVPGPHRCQGTLVRAVSPSRRVEFPKIPQWAGPV